jgi:sulfite exporter TauE/SafE/copper chaperone CopZ
MSNKKECVYKVSGMHCAACEILIEKKITGLSGVKFADASLGRCEVVIEYSDDAPQVSRLNKMFAEDNYVFSHKTEESGERVIRLDGIVKAVIWAIAIYFVYSFARRLGLEKYANVNASSSLPAFFLLGIIAGASTCAALVGGIILSMSKQWSALYDASAKHRAYPHLLFNAGRIASYAFFGAVLGALGVKLQVSVRFSAFLVLAISVVMLSVALKMLGVGMFRRFQLALPKFITRGMADEKKFKGKYMPALMGAATFFLPCGFTMTVQSISLISGSAWQGGLVMMLFALGTSPALLAIGLASSKFYKNQNLAERFAKIAGVIILFFALYNINAQFTVLGWKTFGDFFKSSGTATIADDLPPIVDGKQILKMNASSRGYSPNSLKVRVGIPVRWEVKDTGTSGCTNAIISKLFDGQIDLTPGQTSVKEFTPAAVGTYRFSCWMGMVSGTIEVVE